MTIFAICAVSRRVLPEKQLLGMAVQRIEDAYALVKRLLGLAYFWVGAQNGVALQVWATWLLYAILVDLTDAVAEALNRPFAAISLEMVYAAYTFSPRPITGVKPLSRSPTSRKTPTGSGFEAQTPAAIFAVELARFDKCVRL